MAVPDSSFDEFVSSRGSSLLRSAYLLCGGDRQAAEDLLQDVLERVFLRWRRIHGDPEAYARAALANAAANRWRRRSRRVAEAPMEAAGATVVPGHERGVAERDAIVRALGMVPARARAVLVLRFFEDLTEAQTAAALGCSVGTVKSQGHKGLARLRELLAGADTRPPLTLTPALRKGSTT